MKVIVFVAAMLLWSAAFSQTKQISDKGKSKGKYHSISPGATWLDTDGKPIQAHGFSVFYNEGTYYWYGENKEYTIVGSNVWTYGIRCYTSKDFYNWQDRGLIIPPDTLNPLSALHPSQALDRPHIIFCPKTKKYVCWIKIMGGSQSMIVLQADNVLGPYQIVRKPFLPAGFESGDFDLYVDQETGKGYIWFERPHTEMICANLTDDFTSADSVYSTHFAGKSAPETREAPVHFMRNGKHYLFTSGTSGYAPNPSLVSTFKDYHGSYVDHGNPHPLDKSNTSYCSQISDVIKIPGKKDLYIALADRWMPACDSAVIETVYSSIRKVIKNHKVKERSFEDVEMTDRRHVKRTTGNATSDAVSDATYVWLPIKWENGVPKVYWKDEWKLEDFK